MKVLFIQSLSLVLLLGVTSAAFGQSNAKKAKTSAKATTATKAQEVASKVNALVPAKKSSFLSTGLRKPATFDPNSAIEVRGQARTLSMMLVLKNGKDGINFIKVRKDYRPEILSTDY